MTPILNQGRSAVGWLHGDVLFTATGEACAFVRGRDVLTFRTGRIGGYADGLFRNAQGEVVGCVGVGARFGQRRRRYQITPWLRFSRPAPRPVLSFRTWAIWDRDLDAAAMG